MREKKFYINNVKAREGREREREKEREKKRESKENRIESKYRNIN